MKSTLISHPGHQGRKLLLLAALFFVCSGADLVTAQQQAAGPAPAKATIQRWFGATIEPAVEHKPYFLSGDFNGDTFADMVVLVRRKGTGGAALPGVVALNPFGSGPPEGAALALAVIHGAAGGWDTPNPAGVFLLTDRDFFSTPIWESAQAGLLSLKKRKAGRGAVPLRTARGDAIGVATEAGIDMLLYWDGKTYKLYTPPEEP